MLDPSVPSWPLEEALKFAKLAMQCVELRRRDRPDLGKVILPELNRLRNLAEDSNLISAMGNPYEYDPRQTSFCGTGRRLSSISSPGLGKLELTIQWLSDK